MIVRELYFDHFGQIVKGLYDCDAIPYHYIFENSKVICIHIDLPGYD
jgi:hypothetical protein